MIGTGTLGALELVDRLVLELFLLEGEPGVLETLGLLLGTSTFRLLPLPPELMYEYPHLCLITKTVTTTRQDKTDNNTYLLYFVTWRTQVKINTVLTRYLCFRNYFCRKLFL